MTQIIVRENSSDDVIIAECRDYNRRCKPDKKDVWMDIGAHIGVFTCLIAPKVKHVYSYEPEPENFGLLKDNIEANGLKNVSAYNSAVVADEQPTHDNFYVYDNTNTGLHSFKQRPNGKVKDTLTVSCENINAIIGDCQITGVKMDCEGMEYELLKAIRPEYWKQIRELIFEFHPTLYEDGKAKRDEIIQLLRDKFILFNVIPKDDVVLIYGRR